MIKFNHAKCCNFVLFNIYNTFPQQSREQEPHEIVFEIKFEKCELFINKIQ